MNAKRLPLIHTGRVGVVELTALMTVYSSTEIFLSMPSRIAMEGAGFAWAIPLVSGTLVLIAFLIVHMCLKRFPGENLLQVISRLFGRFTALPLALLFALLLLTQTALVTREFTETVVTTVFPATPSAVITFTFLLVALYYAYKGLEGLSRTALLFSYFFLFGLAMLLILPLSWFDARLLLPFWGHGVGNAVWFGTINTSLYFNVLFLSILYPTLRDRDHFLYVGVISTVVTAVIFSIVLVVFLGTFTAAESGNVPFPLYQLARVIYVGRFVQRLEAIFVFLWTAAAVIKMGFGLWMVAYLYALGFGMPLYRPLLAPVTLQLYVLSFLPPDFPAVLALSAAVFEPYGWLVGVLLPTLLAVAAALVDWRRKRRGKKTGAPSEAQTFRKGSGRLRARGRVFSRSP
ncbi:MAG: GerAB/ArcD/ProY family transporter [Bacilli bacterium]